MPEPIALHQDLGRPSPPAKRPFSGVPNWDRLLFWSGCHVFAHFSDHSDGMGNLFSVQPLVVLGQMSILWTA